MHPLRPSPCYSSDPLSSQVLAKGDVVKVHIGAHIDGFAAISAETIVVGASEQEPVTGRKADVIKAAWHAAEIAMRLVKVGNKNFTVTDAVAKTAAAWDCKPVEGEFAVNSNASNSDLMLRIQACSLASSRKMSLMARSASFSTRTKRRDAIPNRSRSRKTRFMELIFSFLQERMARSDADSKRKFDP